MIKIFIPLLLQCIFLSFVNAQDSIHSEQNNIAVYQSLFVYGGNEVYLSPNSTAISCVRYFRNIGFGLELNRIQMVKEGLDPIGPTDDIYRRDNLHLYYANVLFSYRFVNFCPIKNLKVKIDLSPSFLVGGKNSYYGEIDQQTLQHNSYWKNPERMEYETKFNVFGRLGVGYTLFKHFELGLAYSSYLKFIAPKFMSLPVPWTGKKPIYKSSYWSLSLSFNF